MTRGRKEHEPPHGPSRRAAGDSPDGPGGDARFAVILSATGLAGRYLVARLAGMGFEGWCLTRAPEPVPYEVPEGFSGVESGRGCRHRPSP